ncbi:alpha/beta hydrolase [Alicyclobacillus tolerans]|uniref:alpha/beta fold hydrolase n=1 Tax=Alicyclobacillus tolerans TaxID=90970 RepID=UPI001F40C01D|nr:alpha/beta hydrolase [Alicyclobacillus tolerans]MCF8566430.1 alpha/beta hydrolase [Alicyclobacillus tolerans]
MFVLVVIGVAAAVGLAFSAAAKGLGRKAERQYPPEGQWINVDGLTLHGISEGSGLDVICLHGNPGFAQDFDELVAEAVSTQRPYRIVRLDRPGHGYSQRPFPRGLSVWRQIAILHDAIAKLGAVRPVLVGYSWSGAAVLAYALKYPAEVRGVVVIGGQTEPVFFVHAVSAAARLMRLAGFLAWAAGVPIGRLAVWIALKLAFSPDPVPTGYQTEALGLWTRPPQLLAALDDFAALAPFLARMQKDYSQLQCPVAILAGDADKLVDPSAHSAQLHRQIPHSQFIVVPGAGHALTHTHPNVVWSAVDSVVLAGDASGRAASRTRTTPLQKPDPHEYKP